MSRTRNLPNDQNASASDIEAAIRATKSEPSRHRLRSIKALILGGTFEYVMELFDVPERTLRTWVAAFNEQGIDGVIDADRPGRPPAIAAENAEHIEETFAQPQNAGRSHWTGTAFHGYLREELKIEIGYSTVIRWLHDRDFRLKVPQPWPDRQNEEERRAFVQEKLAPLLADPDVELWFGDEMGVEAERKPVRQWGKTGKPMRVVKNGDHVRMNVTGIVCPRTGEAFLLEFTHNDTAVFQAFLDEANKDLAPAQRKRQILILDNASWHTAASLKWGRFEALMLPKYSPDLNPIERLWLVIKQQWFRNWRGKTKQDFQARLDEALLWAMDRKTANKKTCSIRLEV